MPTTAAADIPVRNLQDILTALERHPEWRRALRQQLLGDELLELPAVFAKFATETTRRSELLNNDVDTLKSDVDTLKSDMVEVKTAITRLTNDVGILKGAHAEATARSEIAVIADELGLEHRRIVPKLELRRMARAAGADLQDDAIKSFLASDIIAEATDAQGETTYLAVETSFTGDLHDADRAREHAALMERLMGRSCRAVIASRQKNAGLAKLVERGEIAWHELTIRIQPAA